MPEISCTDFTFPLLTRAQAFALLRLLEFDSVDLGLFERNDHARTSAMVASPGQFALNLLQDLQHADLRVSDIFLQIGVEPAEASANDPNVSVRRRNREVFERSLELCCGLSCKHITGLPGVPHGDPQRDFAYAAEETQWRVSLCEAAGVTYAIEPHIGSICAYVSATRRLLDAVPGLTLTLDYGHFIAAGSRSEDVHCLLPSASHLHLRGGAAGHLQTSVADNTIDFEGMLRRLHGLDFKGVMALEYVWLNWEGCNESDTLSETLLLRQAVKTWTEAGEGKAGWHV